MKEKEICEETVKRRKRKELREQVKSAIKNEIAALQARLSDLKTQEKCQHMLWSRTQNETPSLCSRECKECGFVHYYLKNQNI